MMNSPATASCAGITHATFRLQAGTRLVLEVEAREDPKQETTNESEDQTTPRTRPLTCNRCGACCMGQNLLPLMAPILPNQLEQARLNLLAEGPLAGDDHCPCIWLDRYIGRCRYYEQRPDVCRELKVGGDACMRIRKEAGIVD